MNSMTQNLTEFEDELHEQARRGTGFEDFGDSDYLKGLRALLNAYDTDLPRAETIRQFVLAQVRSLLTARLYTQKGWSMHPEVLAIPIRRPLMITGLPRSGTTALHRLLSADPRSQSVELWLSGTPMIRPPRQIWAEYKEYRTIVAELERLNASIPDYCRAHSFEAGEPEECDGILMQSFVTDHYGELLPTYSSWCSVQTLHGAYVRYANVLRLIGGSEPHKRWVLKSPDRMATIDAFLDVFPDACVIQTHRDPLQVIPSVCSLANMQYQQQYGAAPISPEKIGPLQCSFWRKALDHIQMTRRKLPRQFFDVDHRRFLADPLGTVRSVYDYFGVTMTLEAEQQMRIWIAASPTSRHGKHHYQLDGWGVTRTGICEMFAQYRAEYGFD